MAIFSYTKLKKLSIGNRIGYSYSLANVQTTGSKLYTPFKKITGYLPETTSLATSTIAVATNQDVKAGVPEAYLEFKATAECSGNIIVVGLL